MVEESIRGMLKVAEPSDFVPPSEQQLTSEGWVKTIRTTTLVVGGTHDPATPPAHAELIASSIPDAKLKLLDAAHLSNIEQADEFTAALLDFLGPGAEPVLVGA